MLLGILSVVYWEIDYQIKKRQQRVKAEVQLEQVKAQSGLATIFNATSSFKKF